MAAVAHVLQFEYEGDRLPTADNGGFTVADRDTLTTVKVQLGFLLQGMQDALGRIAKLEETRLTARDLQELMTDTDTLRAEKKELEKRVAVLEQWRWQMVGASAAFGLIGGVVVKLILK